MNCTLETWHQQTHELQRKTAKDWLAGFLLTAVGLSNLASDSFAQSFSDNGKKYNPGLYFAFGGGTGFAVLNGQDHIQGVMKSYRWRDMEPSEGVYDFSEIHANLDQLASVGNKRLMISFQPTVFGPGAPTAPEYITSNPIYGDAGATGGYYGVYDRPSGGYHELLTSEPVRERKKAFMDAVAAEFDSHPLVEHIFGGMMGETAYAEAPGEWGWSARVQENIFKEMVSHAANAFKETSVSTAVNYGAFDKSRYANWAAENGIIVASPDMWMDYTNASRGGGLWFGPEGAYAKQQQLSGRVPTMSIASLGSWDEDWLYDGVNRRNPTAQDFIDYSQASGVLATHPDPNIQGRGTNASYLIGIGYNAALRNEMSAAVAAYVNGGATFAKRPDVIQSTYLGNTGFESPGTGTQHFGWDLVEEWQSDAPARNSGVHLAADIGRQAGDGEWFAFLDANDPAVWNTTEQPVVAGSTYEATLALRQGVNNRTAIAEVTLYYDDNGTRTPIITEDINADDFWFWSERTIRFDADDYPAAIGKTLGIEIANTGASNGLLRFDQVRLARILSGTRAGDFDLDGDVDGSDLADWGTGFGTTTLAVFEDGDADTDGDVDGRDFLAWQRNFNASVATAAVVPEPTTVGLALFVVVAGLHRRVDTITLYQSA